MVGVVGHLQTESRVRDFGFVVVGLVRYIAAVTVGHGDGDVGFAKPLQRYGIIIFYRDNVLGSGDYVGVVLGLSHDLQGVVAGRCGEDGGDNGRAASIKGYIPTIRCIDPGIY
jgi:hypothetical protein